MFTVVCAAPRGFTGLRLFLLRLPLLRSDSGDQVDGVQGRVAGTDAEERAPGIRSGRVDTLALTGANQPGHSRIQAGEFAEQSDTRVPSSPSWSAQMISASTADASSTT